MAARLLCGDCSARVNNFDLLRFCFATLVILSHCYLIASGSNRQEPLYALSHGYLTLGVVAVMGFFTLSGFLILQSWERSENAGDYLKKRALRIYPGFIMASLVCLLIVGPLGTAHLTDYGSRSLLFHGLLNLACLSEPKAGPVFVGNPLPVVLNGSLWSIRYEFLCYLAVMAFGLPGRWSRRGVTLALFGLCWLGNACLLIRFHFGKTLPMADWMARLPGRYEPFLSSLFFCGLYFAAGAVVYQYRDRIVRAPMLAGSALLILAASLVKLPLLFILMLPVCGVYLLFYFAFSRRIDLHAFAARGDFSYGLYLYGFPLQQLLVHWSGGRLPPLALFAAVFPIALCCAMASWHGIERPFLRRKPARIASADHIRLGTVRF